MNSISVFIDGSSAFVLPDKKEVKNAGCGIVIVYNNSLNSELSIGFNKCLPKIKSGLAEITAMKFALEYLLSEGKENEEITIFTDSQYCAGIFQYHDTNSSWKLTARRYVDTIKEIRQLLLKFRWISVEWMKGHVGNIYNEIAHCLANSARLGKESKILIPTTMTKNATDVLAKGS